MTTTERKYIVSHPHWCEDLPDRDAPLDGIPKMVHGDINVMDENLLEVSRTSSIMRGIGVSSGAVISIIFAWAFYFLLKLLIPFDEDLFIFYLIFPFLLFIALTSSFLLLRTDLAVPKDRPVRFNRSKRKIYVYEHAFSWNPFKRWPLSVKIFEWETVHAELLRYAGFNGKAYVQRFSLSLVSCKPNTNKVIDRFELKGNMPTTEELYNCWAYCRCYMEQGVEELPVYPPRRQSISFRRSFFEYIRFLDPTEEGREVRARMKPWEWIFNSIITLLVFWLLIPWGIGHYIAMRFAPDVKWPPDIDAESRSP